MSRLQFVLPHSSSSASKIINLSNLYSITTDIAGCTTYQIEAFTDSSYGSPTASTDKVRLQDNSSVRDLASGMLDATLIIEYGLNPTINSIYILAKSYPSGTVIS